MTTNHRLAIASCLLACFSPLGSCLATSASRLLPRDFRFPSLACAAWNLHLLNPEVVLPPLIAEADQFRL